MHSLALHQRPRNWVLACSIGLTLLAAAYIAVQGVGGFGGWLKLGNSADRVSETLTAVYSEAPQLARLEEMAPDIHERLRGAILFKLDAGLTVDQIVTDVLKLFGNWRAESLPDAPDRVLVAYLELATDRLRELKVSNPEICAAITLGWPAGDPIPFLSAQHLQREMYLDQMLIRSRPDEPVSVMTRAEVASITRDIHAALRLAYGNAADLLYAPSPDITPADAAILCRLGIATMEAIAGLGPQRTPAAVRGIFFVR